MVLCLIPFRKIFLCGRQHEFNSVQLVYFTGSRIVVDSNNVGQRIFVPQLLDDAFAYDMIWKAAERLCAYDIICAGMYEFKHFTG